MKWELEKEIKLPTAALGLSTLPHSESLLVSCFDGSVIRVDPRESTWETLGQHQSYASGVVSVLDGSMAVSAGYDGVLQWHHLGSGKTVAVEKIHDFWSWQLKASPNGRLVASVTGQYLCGGERYEPAQEKEPSIKVFDAQTQSMVAQFSHLPPVLSVAFSPDSRFLAAANMMGDVRVWDLKEQRLECSWNTPDFTSWGIIKSHHYIGGIFDVCFSPGGEHLLVCGMGPMRDPMAGNGKQTWQRFDWKRKTPEKVSEIKDGDRGRGLMETLSWHPDGKVFAMAGRMAQGSWNVALFDAQEGSLIQGMDNKTRITRSAFSPEGTQLFLTGSKSQGEPKEGKWSEFGRLMIYQPVPSDEKTPPSEASEGS